MFFYRRRIIPYELDIETERQPVPSWELHLDDNTIVDHSIAVTITGTSRLPFFPGLLIFQSLVFITSHFFTVCLLKQSITISYTCCFRYMYLQRASVYVTSNACKPNSIYRYLTICVSDLKCRIFP